MTPDELILAAHVKALWAENDYYWIAYDKSGSSSLSQYIISWSTALRLVRVFESLPQVEESSSSSKRCLNIGTTVQAFTKHSSRSVVFSGLGFSTCKAIYPPICRSTFAALMNYLSRSTATLALVIRWVSNILLNFELSVSFRPNTLRSLVATQVISMFL